MTERSTRINRWTAEQLATLRQMAADHDLVQLSDAIGRSVEGVRKKAKEQGIEIGRRVDAAETKTRPRRSRVREALGERGYRPNMVSGMNEAKRMALYKGQRYEDVKTRACTRAQNATGPIPFDRNRAS